MEKASRDCSWLSTLLLCNFLAHLFVWLSTLMVLSLALAFLSRSDEDYFGHSHGKHMRGFLFIALAGYIWKVLKGKVGLSQCISHCRIRQKWSGKFPPSISICSCILSLLSCDSDALEGNWICIFRYYLFWLLQPVLLIHLDLEMVMIHANLLTRSFFPNFLSLRF